MRVREARCNSTPLSDGKWFKLSVLPHQKTKEETEDRTRSLSERSTPMPTSKQPHPRFSVSTASGRTPPTTPTDHKARVQMAMITGARQNLDLPAAARALKNLPKRQLDSLVAETKTQTRHLLMENDQLMNPNSPTSLDKKE